MTGALHIGTSGWSYRHWRERFYPKGLRQGDWLAYYAERFATVELNASFYRVPSEAAMARWRELAPEGFVFAVKASRLITHVQRLVDCAEPLDHFLSRARLLGPCLGPILYQLPPSWEPDAGVLAGFAERLPKDLLHVFEFRAPAGDTDALRAVLAERGHVFCIHDMAGRESPRWVTGPAVYLRFHGGAKGHLGHYGETALAPWAAFAREALAAGRDVYAYFNNDGYAHAIADARTLRALLAER